MEEDAGKLLHEGIESRSDASFVDVNRSGMPLIEIVTEPDLNLPSEAHEYLSELKTILRYTGVSSANMEEGNLRCDANIWLRPKGANSLGTKVEIKNLNSFKNVQKALEFEIQRQTRALEKGETIVQETRLFDADRGVTETMRSKEEAHDYRYFPEPDLLPLKISPELLSEVRKSLPELPAQKRVRFAKDYGLSHAETSILTEERALADYYEETARLSGDPKQAANWILRDLLKTVKDTDTGIEELKVTPKHIAGLIKLIRQGAASSSQA